MKCLDKNCNRDAKMGCSGLCLYHYEEMLREQKENNPEAYQENISW